eukprot:14834035-Ditylum_brightwellii.AAC.1
MGMHGDQGAVGCLSGDVTQTLRRILSSGSMGLESALSLPITTMPNTQVSPPSSPTISNGRSSPLASSTAANEKTVANEDMTPTK